MRRLATILLLALLAAPAASAQSVEARDQAVDLATITLAHELCGFDLSDAQEDAIAKRRQALVDDGAIDAADLAAIEAALGVSMKRQVPEGLCKPGGGEAKLYRQKLDALGGG